jgi:hypothetical protein
MTSDNNQKRLDELLHEGLGQESVRFDFEAWKATHREQVAQFRQQGQRPAVIAQVLQSRPVRFAMAACLIIAAGVVLQMTRPPRPPHVAFESAGPAVMMSRLQLTMAYADGGIEGLEEQYNKAYAQLGPRAGGVSVSNLFNQF